MSAYQNMATRQRKWFLYVIAVIVIVLIVIPDNHFFLGLFIGSVVSYYNLWLLQRKTDQFGETIEKGGKRAGLGTVSRFAMAALGAIIVLQLDVSVIGYVIGLMLSYPIIMIDFIVFQRK